MGEKLTQGQLAIMCREAQSKEDRAQINNRYKAQ